MIVGYDRFRLLVATTKQALSVSNTTNSNASTKNSNDNNATVVGGMQCGSSDNLDTGATSSAIPIEQNIIRKTLLSPGKLLLLQLIQLCPLYNFTARCYCSG
jgi:hypothetical protein